MKEEIDWSKDWSKVWTAITGSSGDVANTLNVISLVIAVIALALLIVLKLRGKPIKGPIAALIIAALLGAPGLVFPLLLKLASLIANIFLRLLGLL